MKIVSVATMQRLDAETMSAHASGEVLMQRAGEGVCQCLLEFLQQTLPCRHWQRFAVIAGKGNNGGDAYVVARRLRQRTGLPVRVYSVGGIDQLRGDARLHAEKLPTEVEVVPIAGELPAEALAAGTVIIDGLLGTGAGGDLRAPYPQLITAINRSAGVVVAIDLPSGLNADSGEIATAAVNADLTVCIALPKPGLFTANGQRCCGTLRCVPIGIADNLIANAESCGDAIFAADATAWLPRRDPLGHKGSFGHVLIVAGSSQYCGAPMLSGTAALRIGAGMVSVAMPAAARAHAHSPLAALIVHGIADGERGVFGPASRDALQELLQQKLSAIIFGPGVSRQRDLQAAMMILRHEPNLPLVIDADGLHILAQQPQAFSSQLAVLTPHPGEWQVLADAFELKLSADADRRQQATALAAKTGAYVVLKGAASVIAAPDGRWAVNSSGNSSLGTAGSGDVLAGMIGGLLAQHVGPWQACCLATFVHGYAAELSGNSHRALVADDLPDLLGQAMLNLSPFA